MSLRVITPLYMDRCGQSARSSGSEGARSRHALPNGQKVSVAVERCRGARQLAKVSRGRRRRNSPFTDDLIHAPTYFRHTHPTNSGPGLRLLECQRQLEGAASLDLGAGANSPSPQSGPAHGSRTGGGVPCQVAIITLRLINSSLSQSSPSAAAFLSLTVRTHRSLATSAALLTIVCHHRWPLSTSTSPPSRRLSTRRPISPKRLRPRLDPLCCCFPTVT
jgi:hypothetical protein